MRKLARGLALALVASFAHADEGVALRAGAVLLRVDRRGEAGKGDQGQGGSDESRTIYLGHRKASCVDVERLWPSG
jgi:hypothetical protein